MSANASPTQTTQIRWRSKIMKMLTQPTLARRLLAGALAFSVLFSSTAAFARGGAAIGNLGAGLEDLMDPGFDVPLPDGANLPAALVPGIEVGAVLPGDIPVIPGAPGTMVALPPVVSLDGQLVTPLQGVGSDGFVNGLPAQPGVLTPLGPLVLPPQISLKDVPIPSVQGIERFISNRGAAVALGKALFWDMQVGSDGQACASCHFHAGADNRLKNQLSPGLKGGDTSFQPTATGGGGPNYTLKAADFPFHRLANAVDRNSAVLFDSNDVVSSQGTQAGAFASVLPAVGEKCGNRPLDEFNVHGLLTRKVEPRNTPTVINAVFNFRNFWDGRANNVFNGSSPFGNRDPGAKVLEAQADGTLAWVKIELPNSSLASQAVGPALSDFEMSCSNKSFQNLGRKLLSMRPLAKQKVDAEDSVLAADRQKNGFGLRLGYDALIKAAFAAEWWKGTGTVNGYTQMENNFSLFWGLAIMAYEATLVSDNAPIDQLIGSAGQLANTAALTPGQLRGMAVFRGRGHCESCHKGAEYTGAATELQPTGGETNVVEHMLTADGHLTIYDNGFYNIGVRGTVEDRGVGAQDPFGNSLSFSREYLDLLRGTTVVDPLAIDPCLFSVLVDVRACWTRPDPALARVSVDGAFKTPSLRNVSLTQPYFHNGSRYTLEQVVEFYNRGGDRRGTVSSDSSGLVAADAPSGGSTNAHPQIQPLGLSDQERADLVDFVRHALTDSRVACEQAPFDHPELRVFNGHIGDAQHVVDGNHDGKADDDFIALPPVGAKGLPGSACLKHDNGTAVVSSK